MTPFFGTYDVYTYGDRNEIFYVYLPYEYTSARTKRFLRVSGEVAVATWGVSKRNSTRTCACTLVLDTITQNVMCLWRLRDVACDSTSACDEFSPSARAERFATVVRTRVGRKSSLNAIFAPGTWKKINTMPHAPAYSIRRTLDTVVTLAILQLCRSRPRELLLRCYPTFVRFDHTGRDL